MELKRSWWQKAMKPLGVFSIVVVCILIIALLAVIIMVYVFNVNIPGLRGKTLWDWLQLLIIPLVLAVIALVFQLANSRTERQIATQRYEQDQQIALDKQHEDLLQAYLDRMSELLLKESLRTSPSEEVRNVARVRTLTVLCQLDARRISNVFTFLREAGLMSTTSNDNVVSLRNADLSKVNWSQADLGKANLCEVDLSGANLCEADFSGAILAQTNLSETDLSGANLCGADLSGANLSKAILSKINLSQANLGQANLSEADLCGAILADTDLSEAILYKANLRNANLRRAILVNAHLLGADLSGANLAQTSLSKTKSLEGATMPDGSIHE